MARSTDPNSAGSQFYITMAPQPTLDGQYAVFGQVTSGMDVVRALTPGVRIISVSVQETDVTPTPFVPPVATSGPVPAGTPAR